MSRSPSEAARRPVRASLGEYGRGVTGGLLFSMPLLYTMELWQTGHRIGPARLLGAVLVTFVVLLGYNRYAGLREDASFAEVAIDSVEEFGIGLALSAGMLWLMGLVGGQRPAEMQIERLVVEALVSAIGVSVGTAQLNASEDDSGMQEHDGEEDDPPIASDVTLSTCGTLLLATSIAPTDEVPIIAASTSPLKLLVMLAVSLALAGVILAYSLRRVSSRGGAPDVIFATVVTVAVALAVSALLLWFFDRFEGRSLYVCLAQAVVLAVPASLGAAAGRLLLQ